MAQTCLKRKEVSVSRIPDSMEPSDVESSDSSAKSTSARNEEVEGTRSRTISPKKPSDFRLDL